MLIDAFRSDYIFNRNHSFYLKSIEQIETFGNVLSIKLRCHTPTVTLPRLKVNIYKFNKKEKNFFTKNVFFFVLLKVYINRNNTFILGCYI